MFELVRKFRNRNEEDGASAVEYGLLVAGIAALIVAVVFLFGGLIKNVFTDTCDTIVTQGAAHGSSVTANCDDGGS